MVIRNNQFDSVVTSSGKKTKPNSLNRSNSFHKSSAQSNFFFVRLHAQSNCWSCETKFEHFKKFETNKIILNRWIKLVEEASILIWEIFQIHGFGVNFHYL